MRGRKPGKTEGVFAAIHRGFFRAEHDADSRRSFVAVERSMLDRFLGSEIYTEGGGLVAGLLQGQGTRRGRLSLRYGFPHRLFPAAGLDRNCICSICSG